MGLPGCLCFCHLSGEEQVGLAGIVKYLGFCTWYSPGYWKMGHMPLWFADTLPSARQQQPPEPQDRTGCNVCTLNRGWKEIRCSFISFTCPSIHCSKIYLLISTLYCDPCLALETLKERVVNMQREKTRTKTGERVWWKDPGLWSQADLSLPPGSTTSQEITSNLSLYPPSVEWTERGRHGEFTEIMDAKHSEMNRAPTLWAAWAGRRLGCSWTLLESRFLILGRPLWNNSPGPEERHHQWANTGSPALGQAHSRGHGRRQAAQLWHVAGPQQGACFPLPSQQGKEDQAQDSPASWFWIFSSRKEKTKDQGVNLKWALGCGGVVALLCLSEWGSPLPTEPGRASRGSAGAVLQAVPGAEEKGALQVCHVSCFKKPKLCDFAVTGVPWLHLLAVGGKPAHHSSVVNTLGMLQS